MKIAIVGTGISGMVAAYLLSGDHEITVLEKNDYIGGHTHTVDVSLEEKNYAVDTGFIVFNEVTYPNFVRLLRRLGVPWKPSRMSFSLRCEQTSLEFSPSSFDSLFAQRRNLLRPGFYRMVLDIFRFRKKSLELLDAPPDPITLERYLRREKYSPLFVEKFILPMGAAIWSADPARFREFPAQNFVRFFHNHGFLRVRNQPQWLVIRGGSGSYMEKLTRSFADRIRLRCAVQSIARRDSHVEVRTGDGVTSRFDAVILALHSDEALAVLSDPSEAERELLSAIPYQENMTILHTDSSILPRRRKCWASWNYHVPLEPMERVALTYDMNILQGLDAPVEFCVTLNRPAQIAPEKVLRSILYAHPVFTPAGVAAQARREEINGVRRTYFCGAYWGYGFHEDGVKSALAVCKHFGKDL
ncbi:MAG: FAD-dependent oxidoreductase [Deltaproteobacteria bacterium]|nr:FAD-dependent oxidoreductase [Deltaproteobacteria bacterium]